MVCALWSTIYCRGYREYSLVAWMNLRWVCRVCAATRTRKIICNYCNCLILLWHVLIDVFIRGTRVSLILQCQALGIARLAKFMMNILVSTPVTRQHSVDYIDMSRKQKALQINMCLTWALRLSYRSESSAAWFKQLPHCISAAPNQPVCRSCV